MAIMMKTAQELMIDLGQRARENRLGMNLTQAGLAKRSGVSLAVIRLFEQSGKISLESLLKLAIGLGSEKEFDLLFPSIGTQDILSMDELLKRAKPRKRGRIE